MKPTAQEVRALLENPVFMRAIESVKATHRAVLLGEVLTSDALPDALMKARLRFDAVCDVVREIELLANEVNEDE